MLIRIFVFWLAMSAVPAAPSPAQEGLCNGKNALIYYGAVADQDSALELASIFEGLGCEVEYFCRMDQLHTLLEHAAILVIGGTGEDLSPVHDELESDPGIQEAIQAYLDGGGRYLGICGGAFLASAGYEECYPGCQSFYWQPALELIKVETEWYDDDETQVAQLVKIHWVRPDRTYGTFYQAGPVFLPLEKGNPDGEVLATYPVRKKDEPAPAAVIMADHGPLGRVLLLGPHPEATKEWLAPNDLRQSEWQDSRCLLVEAIWDLMEPR